MVFNNYKSIVFLLLSTTLTFSACGHESESTVTSPSQEDGSLNDKTSTCDADLFLDQLQPITLNADCIKANQKQIEEVNLGNAKREQFLSYCYQETGNSCWCDQLVRPNIKSLAVFQCTYGDQQAHQLIHPDEATWVFAIEAVKIVKDIIAMKLEVKEIYNWWRPEPYNKNVGGAAGRHPYGTSVDIRFATKSMQDKAFARLCDMRKKGRLRAVGYYPSTAIHLGVGDKNPNTWGAACP